VTVGHREVGGFDGVIPDEFVDRLCDETEEEARARGRDPKTDAVTHFGRHCEFTGATDADPASWHRLRRELLTASSMAAILGEDTYRDAYDVFVEKTTTPITTEERLELDDPRLWGKVLEQPILTTVANHYGWQYQRGGALLRSRRHPLFGATLDAEINRNDGAGWLPLEGKTSVVTKDWDEANGELPTRVLIQGHHQMLVTGTRQVCVFALLVGSRPCMIDIEHSDEFQAMILDAGLEFSELLKRGDCPSPTARADVRKRFPGAGDGSTVKLGIEFVELTRDYFQTNKEIARLVAEKERIQNVIRDAIGEATFGELPEVVEDKLVWKWAEQLRSAYTVPAGSSRILRPLKDHPREKQPRKTIAHATISADQSGETAQRFKSGRRRIR
jgi:putative phage-type endonuclease